MNQPSPGHPHPVPVQKIYYLRPAFSPRRKCRAQGNPLPEIPEEKRPLKTGPLIFWRRPGKAARQKDKSWLCRRLNFGRIALRAIPLRATNTTLLHLPGKDRPSLHNASVNICFWQQEGNVIWESAKLGPRTHEIAQKLPWNAANRRVWRL